MGFKFNDRTCVIEIEDVKYRVVFQKALVDRLNGAKDVFSRMKKEGCTDNDKAVAAFDNAIDGVLGKGSAEKIFAGRFPNIAERYAVLKYVYDEITEFMNGIAGEKNVPETLEGSDN